MTILQAIILGAVQGITEFIPVSSSGHLIALPYLVGWEYQGLAFDIVVHIGTLVAILVVFWKRIWAMVRGVIQPKQHPKDARLAAIIIVATIPAALVGALFSSQIEHVLRSPVIVVWALLGGSAAMAVADYALRRYGSRAQHDLQRITWGKGIAVGVMQTLALIPGVSRSGITMSTASWFGISRSTAAEYSFLLGAPVFFGAGVLQFRTLLAQPNGMETLFSVPMLLGFVAAVVTGIFAIRFLLQFLQDQSFTVFIVYRVLLAGLIVILL